MLNKAPSRHHGHRKHMTDIVQEVAARLSHLYDRPTGRAARYSRRSMVPGGGKRHPYVAAVRAACSAVATRAKVRSHRAAAQSAAARSPRTADQHQSKITRLCKRHAAPSRAARGTVPNRTADPDHGFCRTGAQLVDSSLWLFLRSGTERRNSSSPVARQLIFRGFYLLSFFGTEIPGR